jgi:hypothetical protein
VKKARNRQNERRKGVSKEKWEDERKRQRRLHSIKFSVLQYNQKLQNERLKSVDEGQCNPDEQIASSSSNRERKMAKQSVLCRVK